MQLLLCRWAFIVFSEAQKLIIKVLANEYLVINNIMIRLQQLKKLLPVLRYKGKKGSSGLVGVIGGSFQYTGAPFYSAMAAVRMGADLAHVFCAKEAATAIKSYSPQLIVHPVFDYDMALEQHLTDQQFKTMSNKWCKYFQNKLQKISSWVLGPGLGRSKYFQFFVPQFIKLLPQNSNIVIDADGLFFLCKKPDLLEYLQKLNCVLTPNFTEFKHLNKILKIDYENIVKKYVQDESEQKEKQNQITNECKEIKQVKLDKQIGVTVVVKGHNDLVLHRGDKMSIVQGKGSKKRCGGIGDVLSGCIAACIKWDYNNGPLLGCYVTRLASQLACQKHGRSLTGMGVLDCVPEAVRLVEK